MSSMVHDGHESLGRMPYPKAKKSGRNLASVRAPKTSEREIRGRDTRHRLIFATISPLHL